MIMIQMLPANALIIPLYVVLARYHQVNQLSGLIITYLTFVLPFSIWMLRGFIIGIPRDLEEAAMVDGNSRFGAFVKILLPLVAPGLVATSIFAFIQAWNEFIFAYILLSDQQKQTLTVWLAELPRHEPRHRLGRADGRRDADRDPGRDLLPDRPAPDRVRADRGGGARMSAELERLAAACIFPSFPGPEAPDWILRRIEDGLGGICLFSYNVARPRAARRR